MLNYIYIFDHSSNKKKKKKMKICLILYILIILPSKKKMFYYYLHNLFVLYILMFNNYKYLKSMYVLIINI